MDSHERRTFQDPTGPYQLPNDAPEHDRLDAQSASIIALMNNKPIHAPLSSPKKILDIGCGTGAMTVILAKQFPQAQVIGIDIAPVPADRHGQTPSNVTYIQGDIRQLINSQDPNFQAASFDFIFERLLILALTDWPGHISAISSLLKPNGWLECQEFEWTIYAASGERPMESMEAYAAVVADSEKIGLNVNIGRELPEIFRSGGGFGEVKHEIYECAPHERVDRPELIGLERQIPDLWRFMIGKICSGKRSEEDIAKYQREFNEMWTSKLDGTERHRMHVVIGQKK
ncbi:uncharacterized protein RCC_07564 [Ramularia collo-cygni]|uniref:Uncharacterized protein n=1 Tax=Ramularia collo-cygni TaxID=112498 RepID=A0A2D3VI81_9PEZI|nr:uncharacterized protein RCC_07564 [Ramularia collo-cygni]CZT21699.1 uncharacterized protein RCC_07564 [Ramularia collo-cygni]